MVGAESGHAGAISQRRCGFGRLSAADVGEPGPPDSRADGHGGVHGRGYVWIGAAIWNGRSGAGRGVDQCPEQLLVSLAGPGCAAIVTLQSYLSSLAWALRYEPRSGGGTAVIVPGIDSATCGGCEWNCTGGLPCIALWIRFSRVARTF